MAGTTLTFSRHNSPTGSWEMATAMPDRSLAGHVLRYSGYVERSDVPVRRLEAPWAGVVVIISFGPRITIHDAGGSLSQTASFVGGLSDAPTYTEYDGDQHGIQIDLTPLAASAVLGVPGSELTNRVIDLEDILGRRTPELVERLYEAPSWPERFAILDATLQHRLDGAPVPAPEIAHAVHRLTASRGRALITDLREETGWSARHLATRFRRDVGLGPKLYGRVLRFEHATKLLEHNDGTQIAEIALECGYYDQAHLARDFREFAGTSPARYIGRLLPGGGGVAAEDWSLPSKTAA
jgi:AraC-like DNA-binding protein